MFSQTGFVHMERALALAKRGMYTTDPNPRVGCVLVKNGEVIGEGFTQPAGQDHAEIRALKDARSRGHDLRDATAYVTLEPCSHFGRTPPCVNALIEAQVARRQALLHLGGAAARAARLHREGGRRTLGAAPADQLRLTRWPGEHVGREGDGLQAALPDFGGR